MRLVLNFNCFGTLSSDAKKNIKTTKPPARIQNLRKFSPPVGRVRSLQDGASASRRNYFAVGTQFSRKGLNKTKFLRKPKTFLLIFVRPNFEIFKVKGKMYIVYSR